MGQKGTPWGCGLRRKDRLEVEGVQLMWESHMGVAQKLRARGPQVVYFSIRDPFWPDPCVCATHDDVCTFEKM